MFRQPLRLYVLLALIGGGVYLAVWIGTKHGPPGSAPLYSPLALAATVLLWAFHVSIQHFTRRQVEYLLLSISVVLFIQAFTILIILLAPTDIITVQLSNTPPPPLWALLVLSISALALLALVVGQAVVIVSTRAYQRTRIDQFITCWFGKLTQDDCRKLVAVKDLLPMELGEPEILERLNGVPAIWSEIEGLLPQCVPQDDRDNLLIALGKGGSPGHGDFQDLYQYLGGSAVIIGSWVVVFGTVFI